MTTPSPHDTDDQSKEMPLEPYDWDQHTGTTHHIPRQFVLLSIGIIGLLVLYKHATATGTGVLYTWSPTKLTWLFRLALLTVACFTLPTLLNNHNLVWQFWRGIRSKPTALASFIYLHVFSFIAIIGPVIVGRPRTNASVAFQPPLFFDSPVGAATLNCVGSVVNGNCQGTIAYPLGTATVGYDVIPLLVAGIHVSFQVAVVAAALMVPLGTAVGVTAGYLGGIVDDLLMGYIDIQQSVPAFLVYIVLVFEFQNSLFLLILVFGLLTWGSIARLVRNEVIQQREAQYIEAAQSAGVSRLTIIRRHILPNISNSIIVGASQQIPQLVLLEAALTYIGLGDTGRFLPSFGDTIASGFQGRFGSSPLETWWVWLFPVIVLTITVVAFSIAASTLEEILNPQEEI